MDWRAEIAVGLWAASVSGAQAQQKQTKPEEAKPGDNPVTITGHRYDLESYGRPRWRNA